MDTETLAIKLFVDKISNKVVFAECDAEFLNILLSFLTLPTGSIVRVLDGKSFVGSLDNLYASVVDLDESHLSTPACKEMLLQPRNNAVVALQKLKINPDPDSAMPYYTCGCSECSSFDKYRVTMVPNVPCPSGKDFVMDQVVDQKLALLLDGDERCQGFIRSCVTFMISDDFHIYEASTTHAMKLVEKLGAAEVCLVPKVVDVGLKQILQLLQRLFYSKSVLTDVFVVKQTESHGLIVDAPLVIPAENIQDSLAEPCFGNIKLFINKKSARVLYAEVKQEFVDLLFSFLVFPLGSVAKKLNGLASLGSVGNLYASAGYLSSGEMFISKECSQLLLDPILPPLYNSRNQLIRVRKHNPPRVPPRANTWKYQARLLEAPVEFVDPKKVSYINSKATFMVTDDLSVHPFSFSSGSSHFQDMGVLLEEVEEKIVGIGGKEALQILGLSLSSRTVLTETFLQKEKQRLKRQGMIKANGLLYTLIASCLVGSD